VQVRQRVGSAAGRDRQRRARRAVGHLQRAVLEPLHQDGARLVARVEQQRDPLGARGVGERGHGRAGGGEMGVGVHPLSVWRAVVLG
jgi:hypothetical protein